MKSCLYIMLFAVCTIQAQVQFSDKASEFGVDNGSYGAGESTLGKGLSFFDFDQDGWDDLTLTSQPGDPIKFYKNNNGIFEQISIEGIDNLFETRSVQWVDIDNDGDYDFYVTSNIDHNVLYENLGDLSFRDITNSSGVFLEDFVCYGSSWGDYNNDGFLDLFVTSRSQFDLTKANVLFENNGDNTFVNVTESAGLFDSSFLSFCAAFFDLDNDGDQDIFVANDREPRNLLYRNEGDGTFVEIGIESGTGVQMNAMSSAIDDFDNDGYLDIYVTNTTLGNAFFRNNGDGTFTDLAYVNGTLMNSVAWGAVFLDADNNGDKDLYVSASLDIDSKLLPGAFYYNGGDGNYSIPENNGIADDARSFGNALGDVNNDGLADIVVMNAQPHNSYLWFNETETVNNWIKIKLEGTESNRMGIGSFIEISVDGQVQYNYTLCGEGFLGQNSAYEFFGIGDATTIDYIKVRWLSGQEDFIDTNIPINAAVTIVEGSNVLGLLNTRRVEEVQLLPNPTNNQFAINGVDQIKRVVMYTMQGQTVRVFNSEDSDFYSVSGLNHGVYLVEIENELGQKSVNKLLVN